MRQKKMTNILQMLIFNTLKMDITYWLLLSVSRQVEADLMSDSVSINHKIPMLVSRQPKNVKTFKRLNNFTHFREPLL